MAVELATLTGEVDVGEAVARDISAILELIFECFRHSVIFVIFRLLRMSKHIAIYGGSTAYRHFHLGVLDHPLSLTRSGRAVLHSGRFARAKVVAICGAFLALGFALFRESALESGDFWLKTMWQMQGNQVYV